MMSAQIHFSIDMVGPVFNASDATVRGAVAKALRLTGDEGVTKIIPDTPIKTGLLRSGWNTARVAWDEYLIQNQVFYSPYQERRAGMARVNLPYIKDQLKHNLGQVATGALNGKP